MHGVLAGLALLPGTALHALDPTLRTSQYQVQCYGIADGLPQGSVQAILQHPDGDLLVGTNRGVVRFDGARAAPLLFDGRQVLDNVQVHRLAAGPEGEIWVAAFDGLYRLHGEQLQTWTSEDGLPQSRITAVHADGERVLVGTHGGSVILPREGADFGTARELGAMRASAFDPEGEGRVWIAALDGLHQLLADGQVLAVGGSEPGQRDIFWSTLRDPQGQRWVGARSGLYRLRDGQEGLDRIDTASGIPALPIRDMLVDRDGQRWFASAGAGIYRERQGRFERVPGLRADVVYSLLEDREGQLWAGTAAGLCRIRDGALLGYGVDEGLGTDFILSVAADRQGRVFVGSNGRGLYVIEQGSVRELGAPGGDPFVNRLILLDDGRMLVSSNAGSFVHDGAGFRPLHPELGRRGTHWAAQDGDGLLWLSSGERSLERIGDAPYRQFELPGAHPEERSRWGFRGRDGAVWISSNRGVYRARGDRVERVIEVEGTPTLGCQVQDPRGVLWCVGSGALLRIEGGEARSIRDPQTLGQGAVLAVQADHLGALWVATTSGLFRAPVEQLDAAALEGARPAFRRFDERHGMRSSEFTRAYSPGLVAATPDGRLWWATMAGVLAVDPERLARIGVEPVLRITRLSANDEVLPPSGWARLPAGLSRLDIEYSALSLSDAASLHLRQRLLPISADWVETRQPQMSVLGLPPGDYRFEVQASIDPGHWQTAGIALDFRVQPHWYQTLPARAGAVLLSALLLVSAPLLGLHAARLRAQELGRQVEQRTADLSRANAELDRIARTDALTGIGNRRLFDEKLQAMAGQARQALALMLVDVDHFKAYNDHFGHPAGDACLKQVALALWGALAGREQALARYGGEEFAVLLTGRQAVDAPEIAEAMRQAVRKLAIEHPETPGGILTISVGIASSSGLGETVGKLLERADQHLYEAKQSGRDRVCGD